MNTHTIQQCVICDYQSRTQGRLKKHLRDSHTQEERLAAGIINLTPSTTTKNNNIPLPPPTTCPTTQTSPPVDNEKLGKIQNDILNKCVYFHYFVFLQITVTHPKDWCG